MISKINKLKFTTQILNDSNEIIKYLYIGTRIPIWPEFHKYILHDLKYFQAKSILLEEDGNPSGNVLIYSDGSDTLYFGYFGVVGDKKNKIIFLLNKLLEYGKQNNFAFIRGPINIPSIIFGFGFMEKDSSENIFVGKPINPPIYQELFLKMGFYTKFKQNSWEGPLLRFNPWKIKKYAYCDYEYFNPRDWDELMELKSEFLRIIGENMPPSAQITPNASELFESWADFVCTYGHFFLFSFVKYKPTGKIIACAVFLPNPFRKDAKGNNDSIVGFSWAIDQKHRRKGLGMLKLGGTILQAREKKIKYGSGIMGSENIANTELSKNYGLSLKRTHLILEYEI